MEFLNCITDIFHILIKPITLNDVFDELKKHINNYTNILEFISINDFPNNDVINKYWILPLNTRMLTLARWSDVSGLRFSINKNILIIELINIQTPNNIIHIGRLSGHNSSKFIKPFDVKKIFAFIEHVATRAGTTKDAASTLPEDDEDYEKSSHIYNKDYENMLVRVGLHSHIVDPYPAWSFS